MEKIKVVLTDDSSLVRRLLRGLLESDADIEVVGEARNGQEAVNLARELTPNLITMDLDMPEMQGILAIEEIMATQAIPILVMSTMANAQSACEAMAHGALEVISKPEHGAGAAAEFVAKVKMLAKIPVITHIRCRLGGSTTNLPATVSPNQGADSYERVFTIASSTGGPIALTRILPLLPASFPCPVLVTQHIADGFAAGMAKWLAKSCKMPVRLGQEGELIMPGVIYLSPSEAHLVVTPSRRIALQERQPGDIFRPSCNALLSSVAEVYGHRSVGIILTGMSSDGANGMERIREAGGITLAQDENSSVIFGMNKVAIDNGSVQQVLPLDSIAQEMLKLAGIVLPVTNDPRVP